MVWIKLTYITHTQSGKRKLPPRNTLANARTPLDGGDAEQESQYAALPSASVGLEGLSEIAQIVCNEEMKTYMFPPSSLRSSSCMHFR